MEELIAQISTMDKAQLKVVGNVLKERWDYLSQLEKYQFNVGDKVQFTNKYGKVLTGTVIKIMKKNIRVKTNTENWAVAPSLLEKVK